LKYPTDACANASTKSIWTSYVNIAKAARKRSAATGTLVGVRLHDDEIKAIDSWARKQVPPVTPPYAIRRLVELGLKAKGK
jgi:hypothetical protein